MSSQPGALFPWIHVKRLVHKKVLGPKKLERKYYRNGAEVEGDAVMPKTEDNDGRRDGVMVKLAAHLGAGP